MAQIESHQAAKAFVQQIIADSELSAALADIRDRMHAGVQAAAAEVGASSKADLDEIARQWQAEFGEPYPETMNEQFEWAVRIGYTPERFDQSTPEELFPGIRGYLLRLRDQHVTSERSCIASSAESITSSKSRKVKQPMKPRESTQRVLDLLNAGLSPDAINQRTGMDVKNIAVIKSRYKTR